MTKQDFLLQSFPTLLKAIDPNTLPVFGKMNVIQMIDHMADSFRMANGKDVYTEIITPVERIGPMQDFLRSTKDFKPNTKNALMAEEPKPARSNNCNEAIESLKAELNDFFTYFKIDEEKTLRNPFFGDLNFEMTLNLLHKHAIHHLRQFNAISVDPVYVNP